MTPTPVTKNLAAVSNSPNPSALYPDVDAPLQEVGTFKVGSKAIALRNLSLVKSKDDNAGSAGRIMKCEGLFVENVAGDWLQVRSMLNDQVGWAPVESDGELNLRVALDAVREICVESLNTPRIRGIYTLLKSDEFGFPVYRKTSMTLSFRREDCTWVFADQVGTCCTIRSFAWKPTVIPMLDIRKGGVVISIGPYKSGQPVISPPDLFIDQEFPPTWSSIDNTKAPTESDVYEWVRVNEMVPGQTVELFSCEANGARVAHPDDVLQGGLGDCWYLAGIASMAEVRGLIPNMFVDGSKLSPDGSCRVRLFDPVTQAFTVIVIDTLIPCQRDEYGALYPAFARLSRPFLPLCDPDAEPRRACWPLLLEKAAAKYVKSYTNLVSGFVSTTYQLCGCSNEQTFWAGSDDKVFSSAVLQPKLQQKDLIKSLARNPNIVPINRDTDAWYKEDKVVKISNMHRTMKSMCNVEQCLLSAGTYRGDNGVVKDHAYTILNVVTVEAKNGKLDFVQLRNPWGSGEWTGRWSDKDTRWEENPEVRKALDPHRDANDGTFFMLVADFFLYFGYLYQSPIPNAFKEFEYVTRSHQEPIPRGSCFSRGASRQKSSLTISEMMKKAKLTFSQHATK